MIRTTPIRASVAVSMAAAVLLLGTAALSAQTPDLAARVNGEGITRARLQSSVDTTARLGYGNMTQPDAYKRVQRQVLDQLIAQELLWQEAKRKGFVATPAEVDQAIAQLRQNYDNDVAYQLELERNGFTPETYREDLKRQMSVWHWAQETFTDAVTVSDEDIHEFYVANPNRFRQPEQVKARHVLINVATDADEATVEAARQAIEKILAEARAGADFAELARQHSEGPTAPRGGDLGIFSRGQMVKPFEDAAFALQPGEISDVVRTRFGFHVIKVEARRDAQIVSEAQAAPSIREYLGSEKLTDAVEQSLEELKQAGSIEILIAQ